MEPLLHFVVEKHQILPAKHHVSNNRQGKLTGDSYSIQLLVIPEHSSPRHSTRVLPSTNITGAACEADQR